MFPKILWTNVALLNAAVLTIGILEAQAHLGFVFFKVHKLFGIKSPTPFPKRKMIIHITKRPTKSYPTVKEKKLCDSLTNKLDSIFVHHPAFD